MRGQVVQHDMDLLVDVQLHGFVKEVEEVLPGPGRATLAEHLAGFYVERSEQVRRAVPYVVVGLLLRLPAVQRQRRLGPVQGLDLLGRDGTPSGRRQGCSVRRAIGGDGVPAAERPAPAMSHVMRLRFHPPDRKEVAEQPPLRAPVPWRLRDPTPGVDSAAT
jgi:hypothetical protein